MKRLFDLSVTLLATIAWVPVLLACSLALLLREGAPLFYISRRRVFRSESLAVIKFRTMRRDADKLVNRATAPAEDGVRFLNIPPDSPLYTRTGRLVERCCFTELPQLLQVLRGEMSLVGNRPLPEDVIAALKRDFPDAEDRFQTRAGLTGPVQLVGRERLSDQARLRIEIAYCRLCQTSYSPKLDFLILLYTVLYALRLKPQFTVAQLEEFLAGFVREPYSRVVETDPPAL